MLKFSTGSFPRPTSSPSNERSRSASARRQILSKFTDSKSRTQILMTFFPIGILLEKVGVARGRYASVTKHLSINLPFCQGGGGPRRRPVAGAGKVDFRP